MAIALCSMASSTMVTYIFKCKSNDANSTMTQDSHLKEPRLQESGFTLGYQAGSFNYLRNGKIEFKDIIEYDDGHNEYNGNSSVYHNMTVFFKGEKGISEFYANGFYPNNRAISAKKKIRYEDLSYNFTDCGIGGSYNLGESYKSNMILVNAKAMMGLARKSDIGYYFAYNATVENGVLETWDTMGWTNKTGARRIDWEQRALMKGNITVENNLIASDLFNLAGAQNWLPCR
jgi:hypothetical protein